jgi:hypothetical protein
MLKKRIVLATGAIMLVLGSMLGVACDDDSGDNGDAPEATEPVETP